MSVTKSDLLRLADLAKLSFTDEELDKLIGEMDSIIAFADTINESVDGGTDEIRSVSTCSVEAEQMREDIVVESLDNDKILSNVEGKDGFFAVKRCVQ